MKEYASHDEIASVPITAHAEMNFLRAITILYLASYLFDMDETGLYWRWAISRSLSTASIPGAKKDRARTSLALCSNADGSDKVPP